MKKFFAATLMAIACNANANVLCEIITKDPRYNVSSYFRTQTACVTTNHAGTTGIASQVARLGAIIIVVQSLEFLAQKRNENRDRKILEMLTKDYKIVKCDAPYQGKKYTQFLVGKDQAIAHGSTVFFNKSEDGIYKVANFSTYKLDLNNMLLTGNGMNGKLNSNCEISESVFVNDNKVVLN